MNTIMNKFDPTDSYSLKDVKMLIIDDDEGLCNSIKFFFEDHDCDVITANDGMEGIEKFDEQKPDIVLIDLNMPKLGGHKVVSYISRKSPEIPVIVVSGTGVIHEAVRAMNMGAWEFVTKPIMKFESLELSVLRSLEKSTLIKENNNYKINLENLVYERTQELKEKSKKLEATVEDLKIARKKAEASDALKSQFLAQMSHEIRTPLNNILTFHGIIKNEFWDKLTPELADSFEIVENAGSRLIRTVELILNSADLASGAYYPTKMQFQFRDLLDKIVHECKVSKSYENIELEIIPPPEVELNEDLHALEHSLRNILDNALKFTPNGKVIIETKICDNCLDICISDTGIGISDEFLPHIFEPFSQEKQGYNRPYDGNGLGLSVAKKYSELNGMRLEVRSKKNEGTQVVLSIPFG